MHYLLLGKTYYHYNICEYLLYILKYHLKLIIDYYTKENKKRIVNEVYIPSLFTKENILGFNNHFGSIYNDNIKLDNKFIFNNNFYGTYTLGLLPRNPSFTKYFIKQLIINKNKKFKIKDFNFKLDKKAYTDFIAFKSNIK